MRFLVDESTGPTVAKWLKQEGHNVTSIHNIMPGAADDVVIKKALSEERILITNDKDFGEKVYNKGYDHVGIILLRLKNERSKNKIDVLEKVLSTSINIENKFIVVTENRIRIAGKKN